MEFLNSGCGVPTELNVFRPSGGSEAENQLKVGGQTAGVTLFLVVYFQKLFHLTTLCLIFLKIRIIIKS